MTKHITRITFVVIIIIILAQVFFDMFGIKANPVSFILRGEKVTLINGVAEKESAPGSASKEVIRYFGNEALGDINGDGKDDKAFLVTEETGGSGTFFYAVALLGGDYKDSLTEAVYIGDRIAPQNLQVENGILLVNYADRGPGEAFTVAPSVGKTLRLKFDPNSLRFGELVQNFEGESR